mgnify:CR=1 FL=1|jgi:hypothetical protein
MKLKTIYSGLDSIEHKITTEGFKIANLIIHLQDPTTAEVLEKPVYEVYYDYNDEDEEYTSSLITESYIEVLDLLDELETNAIGFNE